MRVITCVDKRNGIFFNKRRQRRDRKVIEEMYDHLSNAPIYSTEYSEILFQDVPDCHVIVAAEGNNTDRLLTNGDNVILPDDKDLTFFVEGAILLPFEEHINELVLYRWDKVYPADQYLDIFLPAWNKIASRKFIGHSHDLITEEIYVRKEQSLW